MKIDHADNFLPSANCKVYTSPWTPETRILPGITNFCSGEVPAGNHNLQLATRTTHACSNTIAVHPLRVAIITVALSTHCFRRLPFALLLICSPDGRRIADRTRCSFHRRFPVPRTDRPPAWSTASNIRRGLCSAATRRRRAAGTRIGCTADSPNRRSTAEEGRRSVQATAV